MLDSSLSTARFSSERPKNARGYKAAFHYAYNHVCDLSEAGIFRSWLSARVLLPHLMFMSRVRDDQAAYGFVTGPIHLPEVAAGTALSVGSVSRAIRWLERKGFIRVERVRLGRGGGRLITNVEILSYDAASELRRQAGAR